MGLSADNRHMRLGLPRLHFWAIHVTTGECTGPPQGHGSLQDPGPYEWSGWLGKVLDWSGNARREHLWSIGFHKCMDTRSDSVRRRPDLRGGLVLEPTRRWSLAVIPHYLRCMV